MLASWKYVVALTFTIDIVQATEIGCYLYGYAESGAYAKHPEPVMHAQECQNLCGEDTKCKAFGYFPVKQECWFGDGTSPYVRRAGVVSGPQKCLPPDDDGSPCAQSTPSTSKWPAHTGPESMAAWPLGYEPARLQCWPRNGSEGNLMSCADPASTVVEDVLDQSNPWPANCKHLERVNASSKEACEGLCMDNLMCSAWVFYDDAQCRLAYQPGGADCWEAATPGAPKPTAGQRIVRGSHRNLYPLNGRKIKLAYMFKIGNNEHFQYPQGETECENACLSVLECKAWVLDKENGCYIENVLSSGINGLYPLTTDAFEVQDPAAPSLGQYIQRTCQTPGDIVYEPMKPSGVMAEISFQISTLNVNHENFTADLKDQLAFAVARAMSQYLHIPVGFFANMTGTATGFVSFSPQTQSPGRRLANASALAVARVAVPEGKTVTGLSTQLQENQADFDAQVLNDVREFAPENSYAQNMGVEGLAVNEYVAPTSVPTSAPTLAPTPASITTTTAEPGSGSSGIPWWGWLLVALGGVLLLGLVAMAAVACLGGEKKKKKKSSKKATKTETKPILAAQEQAPVSQQPPLASGSMMAVPQPQYQVVSSGYQVASPAAGYTVVSPAVQSPSVYTTAAPPVYTSGQASPYVQTVMQPVATTSQAVPVYYPAAQ